MRLVPRLALFAVTLVLARAAAGCDHSGSSTTTETTGGHAGADTTGGGAGGSTASTNSTGGSGGGETTTTTQTTGGSGAGFSLRFFGNGTGDIDRVKIPIDALPPDSAPGPPADVGAQDFTIEFWMRAAAADNTAPPVQCGDNVAWIYGNTVVDRDRYNQDRKFGLSLAGGKWVFGVSGDGTGDRTICGTSDVLDGAWHHVAVLRRRGDGRMWLFVDGKQEAAALGPGGDISYPDNGVPGDFCGGPCNFSDPFLVLAAEKHDAGPAYPSYSGHLDELRISSVLRYTADFTPPVAPFTPDPDTAALYHFDEGAGVVAADSSGAPGGPSDGALKPGGSPEGPQWSAETPF